MSDISERDISEELKTLRSDLGRLRSDFRTLLGNTRDQAGEQLRRRLHDGMDQMKTQLDAIRSSSRHAYDRIHERAVNKPLLTLGIAIAAGLLIGKILRRGD